MPHADSWDFVSQDQEIDTLYEGDKYGVQIFGKVTSACGKGEKACEYTQMKFEIWFFNNETAETKVIENLEGGCGV